MANNVQIRYYNPVIETMSRSELLRLQWKKLKQQLEYQYHHNPFYRKWFDENKIFPEKIKGMEDFRQRVPLLNKEEALKDQDENPLYGLRLGISPEKIVRTHLTSGTSGIGQEVYGLSIADYESMSTWAYGLYWSGLERGDMVVNTLPLATHLAGCDSMILALIRAGANSFNLGPFSTEDKLKLMQRFKPKAIYATFPYICAMTLKCQDLGIDPKIDFPDLKFLLVAMVTLEMLPKVQDFWGAKATEFYGSTQLLSGVAFTCESGVFFNSKPGILHFLEHLMVIEILDRETRKPVKPGEEGELVITNLHREGSPLIRFATNDRVRYLPYDACPCGRPFDGIEAGSVSRYDEMMKIKGVNVWPQAVDKLIFSKEEVTDYLGRISIDEKGYELVSMEVEFKKGVQKEIKEKFLRELDQELRSKIGIKVQLKEADRPLPKYDFKFKRWMDERKEGLRRIL